MIIGFYPGAGGNRYLRMLQHLEWQSSGKIYDPLIQDQLFKNRYLLDQDHRDIDKEYILTHCVNSTHIKEKFPGHKICLILGNLQACLRREWKIIGHNRYLNNFYQKTQSLDRLEHYRAFRDPSWPQCHSVEELDSLPQQVKQEVDNDFQRLCQNTQLDSVLAQLEHNVISRVNSAYEIINWHLDYYRQYPVDVTFCDQLVDIDQDTDTFCETMRHEFALYTSEIFDEVWESSYA